MGMDMTSDVHLHARLPVGTTLFSSMHAKHGNWVIISAACFPLADVCLRYAATIYARFSALHPQMKASEGAQNNFCPPKRVSVVTLFSGNMPSPAGSVIKDLPSGAEKVCFKIQTPC